MKKAFVLSGFLALAFFVGCAYDPGANTLPGKTVAPKAGSTFTFKNVQIDTLGKTIDSSAYTSRDSIMEIGTTYSGKTNVTHLSSTDLKTGVKSDTYINYETNGDVSIFTGGGGQSIFGGTFPNWLTLTVQSHTTTTLKLIDTTISFLLGGVSLPVHIVAIDTQKYVNNGTASVSGNTLPVINMSELIVATFNAILLSSSTTSITKIAFAPSIGYITDQRSEPTKGIFGTRASNGSETTLISYTLK